jgi:hypothetical protein
LRPGDHLPARTDLLYGDLRPAARRRAEVDDALPGREKPVGAVDLRQLERRARPVAE